MAQINRNAQSDRFNSLVFYSLLYCLWSSSHFIESVLGYSYYKLSNLFTWWALLLLQVPPFLLACCFQMKLSRMASNMVFSPTITLNRFLFPRDQRPDISNMHLGSPTHYWPYCQLGHSLPFLTYLPLLSYTETCIWAPVKWTCSVSYQLAWYFLTLTLFSL